MSNLSREETYRESIIEAIALAFPLGVSVSPNELFLTVEGNVTIWPKQRMIYYSPKPGLNEKISNLKSKIKEMTQEDYRIVVRPYF